MKKVMIGLIMLSLIFVMGASGCGQSSAPTAASESQKAAVDINQMVDCGKMENPSCFTDRMNQCLPVTAKMTGSDNSDIVLTILGVENETCHFQRTVSSNSALNMDCHFPKGTMNMDTLDQTFGNDRGLQKVVDDACRPVGW